MKSFSLTLALAVAFVVLAGAAPAAPPAPAFDTAKIEQLTGLKGSYNADEKVFKVSQPRTDVAVAVDGWTMPPFMGLTSWAAFQRAGNHGMVMGDLVLFEDEVNPAMSAALDAGLEVTALHNHFFYDEPRVFFMHIGGAGPFDSLAGAVGKTLSAVHAVRGASAQPAKSFGPTVPSPSAITAKPLEEILGKGQSNGGMWKAVIGRSTSMHGATVGKEAGVNTWAAFAGTDSDAVVDGDFVVLESELQGVLKALRHGNVNIVAIHHHMAGESPKMLFLHYWGRGTAVDLARAVHTALETAASRSPAVVK
jgi:hypothetical protein